VKVINNENILLAIIEIQYLPRRQKKFQLAAKGAKTVQLKNTFSLLQHIQSKLNTSNISTVHIPIVADKKS